MPNVKKAYDTHRSTGFEVIGISLDQRRAALEKFVQEQDMTWPQYFDGKAWSTPLARKYGITGIPTMFLVDKKGILRSIDAHGRLQREIYKLLAE